MRLAIGHSADLGRRLEIGASLAVSGVCLTVTELDGDPPLGCVVELSPETLSRTTLGSLRRGDRVNLETALRLGDALGGHWVQGHVDGITAGGRPARPDRSSRARLRHPAGTGPFVVEKGSVSLDGVSLTVSALAADRFEVALIPHTLEVTTLSRLQPGDRVNLEVDILAKYVHRMLAVRGLVPAEPGPSGPGGGDGQPMIAREPRRRDPVRSGRSSPPRSRALLDPLRAARLGAPGAALGASRRRAAGGVGEGSGSSGPEGRGRGESVRALAEEPLDDVLYLPPVPTRRAAARDKLASPA